MVWVYLLSDFSGELRKSFFFCNSAFRQLKVIQGHWFWHQSKTRTMQLPISPS